MFQSSDHRYFYEIQTAHSRTLMVVDRCKEHVKAIVYHLNETMTDPFDIEAHPPSLMNISTGMHATREV
jgi:hypothetical protein